MNVSLPNCWDPALKCSCGDCPEAPFCAPVSLVALLRMRGCLHAPVLGAFQGRAHPPRPPPNSELSPCHLQPPAPPPPKTYGCTAVGLGPHSLSCLDLTLVLAYLVVVTLAVLAWRSRRGQAGLQAMHEVDDEPLLSSTNGHDGSAEPGVAVSGAKLYAAEQRLQAFFQQHVRPGDSSHQ